MMNKRWFLSIALLCLFAIILSCILMVAPQTIAPTMPQLSAQSDDYYLLLDDGGLVWVLHMVNGEAVDYTQTAIIVNLLPEETALRIKAGYRIATSSSLDRTLETLASDNG